MIILIFCHVENQVTSYSRLLVYIVSLEPNQAHFSHFIVMSLGKRGESRSVPHVNGARHQRE